LSLNKLKVQKQKKTVDFMLCKPNTTVSTCILKKKALTASYDVVISHLKYSN